VDGPALVRNYDYPLNIVSNRVEMTSWSGRRVISKAQRPWGGCLDGMNEEGLVASLTFGGSRAQGLGFSIILIVRYVLETCRQVGQAIEALCRIPVALSQNVTVLDRSGDYATLFLCPYQAPILSRLKACTNHQATLAAAADSIERQRVVLWALEEPSMSLEELTGRFLEPPSIPGGFGLQPSTRLYTDRPKGGWTISGLESAGASASINSNLGNTRTTTANSPNSALLVHIRSR
jgi:predicted choloylglycine hydrolase